MADETAPRPAVAPSQSGVPAFGNLDLVNILAAQLVTPLQNIVLKLSQMLQNLPAGNSSQWVPADASGAGVAITRVSARNGAMGAFQLISGTVTYDVTANGANAAIGGLPATSYNETGVGGSFPIYYGASPSLVGILNPNTNNFSIFTQAGAHVINSTLSGATLRFQFSYPTK